MEHGLSALIHKKNAADMKTFNDLIKQNNVSFGVIYGGSIHEYFKHSKEKTIIRMYQNMGSDAFVTSVEEGKNRVKRRKYAFITDSPTVEYIIDNECNLTDIKGNEFKRIKYALALPKHSLYLNEFNDAIRQLKTSGQLNQLIFKHWRRSCLSNLSSAQQRNCSIHLLHAFISLMFISLILHLNNN